MSCARETEIFRAIAAGQWPDRCDDELRAHAASCPSCADVAEVATALAAEREALMRAAHVPPSGAVWWRAQLRARQEAARTARRAINVVQAAVVAVAIIGAAAVLTVSGGLAWLAGAASGVHWELPLLLALATPVVLAPVALYFAVTKD